MVGPDGSRGRQAYVSVPRTATVRGTPGGSSALRCGMGSPDGRRKSGPLQRRSAARPYRLLWKFETNQPPLQFIAGIVSKYVNSPVPESELGIKITPALCLVAVVSTFHKCDHEYRPLTQEGIDLLKLGDFVRCLPVPTCRRCAQCRFIPHLQGKEIIQIRRIEDYFSAARRNAVQQPPI